MAIKKEYAGSTGAIEGEEKYISNDQRTQKANRIKMK
jgi:hypothetical protein